MHKKSLFLFKLKDDHVHYEPRLSQLQINKRNQTKSKKHLWCCTFSFKDFNWENMLNIKYLWNVQLRTSIKNNRNIYVTNFRVCVCINKPSARFAWNERDYWNEVMVHFVMSWQFMTFLSHVNNVITSDRELWPQ